MSRIENDPKRLKTFGFGLKAFKTYPELIPVVSICSVAVMMATCMTLHALRKKTDVRILRGNNKPAPWEEIAPTEKRKLRIVNPKVYRQNKELEQLRREIGSYKP